MTSLPGETDPIVVARAIAAWDPAGPPVVVGTDPAKSPARWAASSAPRGSAILVLPRDGFPGHAEASRGRLAAAWTAGAVLDEVPATVSVALVVIVSHEAPDAFAARIRAVARRPAMRGKLLAAWGVSGPLRADVPAWILAQGEIAALGLGAPTVLATRDIEEQMASFARALEDAPDRAVERIAGPFLWFY
jgi:hypothetical protein